MASSLCLQCDFRVVQVAYEDEHLACVVKPPGVPTQVPPLQDLYGRMLQSDFSTRHSTLQTSKGLAGDCLDTNSHAVPKKHVADLKPMRRHRTGEAWLWLLV